MCNMPRPRGDHPHGKPGGRVSMVVNADHMQVTCADHMQVTCRSHAGMQSHAGHMHVTVQPTTYLISFFLFSHRRPLFFSCRHTQFWSLKVEMENQRRWEGSRDEGRMGDEREEERRKGGKREEKRGRDKRRRGRRWKGGDKLVQKDKKGEGMSKGGEDDVPLSESCAETFVLETLMSSFGSASTLAASTSALYLSHVR